MADEPFDPLAYSEEQAKAAPPAFDPIAYSQAVVADPDRKTEAAAAPVAKEPSMLDKYLGFQESQLAGATGGIGSLAGGLGYLGNLAAGGTPEQAEAMRQRIASGLTYSPKTEEGKKQTNDMATTAHDLLGGAGGEKLGDIVMDKTGSPALASAANTAVNIPQFLVGAKVGKEALGEPVEPVAPKPTEQQATLKKAQDLGYVVPPATSNPTLLNRGIEGVAGKTSVAQAASIKNQSVTNGLVRQELGLPEDAELSHDTMDRFRAQQSQAYEAVKAIPDIKFGSQYGKELNALTKTSDKITGDLPNYKSTGSEKVQALVDSIKPPNGSMSGETAVELSKSLRSEASAYDNSANRTGDPHDRALARAYRGSAAAVENAIQSHLESIGKPELADNWDQARRNIAKSYSVESALDGAGNVDAGKLGKQLIKGKPLSGNLEAAADFANTFPKAAKVGASKESMPGISPLDWAVGGAAALSASGSGHNIAPSLGTGLVWPAARVGARALSTSKVGQSLARPSGPGTPGSIATPLGNLAIAGVPAMDEKGRAQ